MVPLFTYIEWVPIPQSSVEIDIFPSEMERFVVALSLYNKSITVGFS